MPRHVHRDPEATQYDHDLRPNMLAGENHGVQPPRPERAGLTLYDVKEAV